MTQGATAGVPPEKAGNPRLSLLLAAAMFVLVVDTSLMNVSISAVVKDLDTTVSAVQSAIALEALVSAAFILISSKLGDLFGRKRAYVRRPAGVCDRRAGDDPCPEPHGDHHLLGDHRWSRSIAAAAGDAVANPWQLRRRGAEEDLCADRGRGRDRRRGRATARRLRHDLSVLARRLLARGRRHRRRAVADRARQGHPVHGRSRNVDVVGAALSVVGMGGVVLGILVWQEGGEYVGAADRDRCGRALGAHPAGSCGATATAR